MTSPDPDRLQRSGPAARRSSRRRQAAGPKRPPPSQLGIAGRFATELVAALVVGGGLGWGVDWLLRPFRISHQPVFLIVFFVLGAAAGIRNVMRAANEINAEMAAKDRWRSKSVAMTLPRWSSSRSSRSSAGQPLFHIAGHPIYFTNQSLLMVIVVIAASLFLTLAVKPGRLVPTRGQSMAEMSYEFVANMIHSATGEDGLKFFPFVFTLFIFVLFCNFFGMVPGSFTVTSQIAVTFALACAGDPDW